MLKVVQFSTQTRHFLNISVVSFGVSLSKLDFVFMNTFYSNSYSFHPSDQIRVGPSGIDASQKLTVQQIEKVKTYLLNSSLCRNDMTIAVYNYHYSFKGKHQQFLTNFLLTKSGVYVNEQCAHFLCSVNPNISVYLLAKVCHLADLTDKYRWISESR